jgi:hypothetical protein
MLLQISPKITKKNRNKTGNITQTKITGIFTTLVLCHFKEFQLPMCSLSPKFLNFKKEIAVLFPLLKL